MAAAGGPAEHRSGADINEAIDRNAGSTFDLVRIAEDVARGHGPGDRRGHLTSCPGVQVVVEARRALPVRPAVSQLLGYTGPITADELADLQGRRLPGRRPHRQGGRRGRPSRTRCAATTAARSSGTPRVASSQVLQTHARTPSPGDSLELTIDIKKQQDGREGAAVGDEDGRPKRGVVIVMNPQTGEILAHGLAAHLRRQPVRRGHHAADYRQAAQRPGQAAASTSPSASSTRPARPTSSSPAPARSRTARSRPRPWSRRKRYLHARRAPVLRLEPPRLRARQHLRRLRPLERHVLLPAGRQARASTASATGPSSTASAQGPASTCPARRRASCPPTTGSRTRFGQPIFPGETYQAGIGQGYDAVTPLQLINAYAALANGGTLYRPQIVRELLGPDGSVDPAVQARRHPQAADVDAERARGRCACAARNGRDSSATRTTSSTCRSCVAGKSGTAEFGIRDRQGRLPFHSWFAASCPSQTPTRTADFDAGPTRSWPCWPSPTTRGPAATPPPRSSSTSSSCTTTSRRLPRLRPAASAATSTAN